MACLRVSEFGFWSLTGDVGRDGLRLDLTVPDSALGWGDLRDLDLLSFRELR